MSHLMDPDGTDRVVQRRIKEWHQEIEHERNARLLEHEEPGISRRLWTAVARGLPAQLRRVTAAIRHAAHRPIASPEAADVAAKLIDGRQVP